MRRKLKSLQYTDAENAARQCTCNEDSYPLPSQLRKLGHMLTRRTTSVQLENYRGIWKILFKRLTDLSYRRHVVKALVTLRHLLCVRPPSDRVQFALVVDCDLHFGAIARLSCLRVRDAFADVALIRRIARHVCAFVKEYISLRTDYPQQKAALLNFRSQLDAGRKHPGSAAQNNVNMGRDAVISPAPPQKTDPAAFALFEINFDNTTSIGFTAGGGGGIRSRSSSNAVSALPASPAGSGGRVGEHTGAAGAVGSTPSPKSMTDTLSPGSPSATDSNMESHDVPSAPDHWACKKCTFLTPDSERVCAMCETPRPNDVISWACAACTFINPAANQKCGMCDTVRSATTLQPFQSGRTRSLSAASANIPAGGDQKQQSSSPRKSRGGVRGWTCGWCMGLNPNSAKQCRVCQHPVAPSRKRNEHRIHTVQLALPFFGRLCWLCDTCTHVNVPTGHLVGGKLLMPKRCEACGRKCDSEALKQAAAAIAAEESKHPGAAALTSSVTAVRTERSPPSAAVEKVAARPAPLVDLLGLEEAFSKVTGSSNAKASPPLTQSQSSRATSSTNDLFDVFATTASSPPPVDGEQSTMAGPAATAPGTDKRRFSQVALSAFFGEDNPFVTSPVKVSALSGLSNNDGGDDIFAVSPPGGPPMVSHCLPSISGAVDTGATKPALVSESTIFLTPNAFDDEFDRAFSADLMGSTAAGVAPGSFVGGFAVAGAAITDSSAQVSVIDVAASVDAKKPPMISQRSVDLFSDLPAFESGPPPSLDSVFHFTITPPVSKVGIRKPPPRESRPLAFKVAAAVATPPSVGAAASSATEDDSSTAAAVVTIAATKVKSILPSIFVEEPKSGSQVKNAKQSLLEAIDEVANALPTVEDDEEVKGMKAPAVAVRASTEHPLKRKKFIFPGDEAIESVPASKPVAVGSFPTDPSFASPFDLDATDDGDGHDPFAASVDTEFKPLSEMAAHDETVVPVSGGIPQSFLRGSEERLDDEVSNDVGITDPAHVRPDSKEQRLPHGVSSVSAGGAVAPMKKAAPPPSRSAPELHTTMERDSLSVFNEAAALMVAATMPVICEDQPLSSGTIERTLTLGTMLDQSMKGFGEALVRKNVADTEKKHSGPKKKHKRDVSLSTAAKALVPSDELHGDTPQKPGKKLSVAQSAGDQNTRDGAMELNRNKVREEIVRTEVDYVRQLRSCVRHYLDPIKLNARKLGITKQQVSSFISNIPSILALHDEFLLSVQSSEDICAQFFKFAPFFQMYTSYINFYGEALETFTALRSNQKFQKFLEAAQKKLKGHGLLSFLIRPVQRIPRYVLLLRELNKFTPQGCAQYAVLLDAQRKISEIAVRLNERKRDYENKSALLDIQSRLSSSSFLLLRPHRRLIWDGAVKKADAVTGTLELVRVYLFNDMLMWTRPAVSGGAGGKGESRGGASKRSRRISQGARGDNVNGSSDPGGGGVAKEEVRGVVDLLHIEAVPGVGGGSDDIDDEFFSVHRDPNTGQQYFVDKRTGESTWTRPTKVGGSKWEANLDPSTGDTFYVNLETGESAWEVPDGHNVPTVHFWESHRDPASGRLFYSNSRTGETTWVRPKELQDQDKKAAVNANKLLVSLHIDMEAVKKGQYVGRNVVSGDDDSPAAGKGGDVIADHGLGSVKFSMLLTSSAKELRVTIERIMMMRKKVARKPYVKIAVVVDGFSSGGSPKRFRKKTKLGISAASGGMGVSAGGSVGDVVYNETFCFPGAAVPGAKLVLTACDQSSSKSSSSAAGGSGVGTVVVEDVLSMPANMLVTKVVPWNSMARPKSKKAGKAKNGRFGGDAPGIVSSLSSPRLYRGPAERQIDFECDDASDAITWRQKIAGAIADNHRGRAEAERNKVAHRNKQESENLLEEFVTSLTSKGKQ